MFKNCQDINDDDKDEMSVSWSLVMASILHINLFCQILNIVKF